MWKWTITTVPSRSQKPRRVVDHQPNVVLKFEANDAKMAVVQIELCEKAITNVLDIIYWGPGKRGKRVKEIGLGE